MKDKTFNAVKTVFVVLICAFIIFIAALLVYDDATKKNYDGNDTVTFLDVGQGDSALIQSGDFSALIDTGTATNGMNVAKKLRRAGVNKLDVLILTHPHDDHIGCAQFLISEIPIDYIVLSQVLPRDDEDARCYKDLKDYAAESSVDVYNATEGLVINIGNFELTVLMSDEEATDENDSSIIIMAKNGETKFLFTGDAEKAAENKLMDDGINLNCNVLKVGHHGSNTSSSVEFLNACLPEFAVISVGADNSYSHPSETVIKRLSSMGIKTLRTDERGDITFKIINGELSYTAER